MIGVTANVKGADVLDRRFLQLEYAGASRASSKAIRAGLKVISSAQRAAVPAKSGLLARSIGEKFRKQGRGRDRNVMRAKAGFNVGKQRPSADVMNAPGYSKTGKYAPHAHLFALGTMPRWAGVKYGRKTVGRKRVYDESRDTLTGKKVAYRGIMPANSALKRAAAAAEPNAERAMRATLETELAREIARR